MDGSNASRTTDNPCAAAEQPAATVTPHESRLSLTRGQRLLAGTTAAAVLASGVNALVQLAKVLIQG